MDLVLLGYQQVFSHKPSRLPYRRRRDGKKEGFEK
jgi:hypothetical protein